MAKKIQNYIIKNYKLLIILLCFFIFILIFSDIYNHSLLKMDMEMYHFVVAFLRNDIITFIMKIITNFGNAFILILYCIIALIFIKDKNYGIVITSNLVIITLINQALKFLVERPRPIGYRLIEESGYSFPSGHSMVSMAFYGLIIYLISQSKINIKCKKIYICILSILIVLIGFSRIYLGIHYTSDVVAGFCVSIIYLILFITIYNSRKRKK